MQAAMTRSAFFWNRMAARYARQPIADEDAYRRKLETTQSYLRPDMEVLEIGCGTGTTALIHAPFVRHIRAVDYSAGMIGIARGKAEAGNVANVTFEQSTIEGLDAPDAHYDVVLALSILHLLDDRRGALAGIHRLLKPGGLLVASTACIGDMSLPLRLLVPVFRVLPFMPSVRVFTAEELKRSVVEAGFAIEHEWNPGRNKAFFLIARKV